MNVIGYAEIKSDAKSGESSYPIAKFAGKICKVINIRDSSFLVMDQDSNMTAIFKAFDVLHHFKCSTFGQYILPVDCSERDRLKYISKYLTKKGGYNFITKKLIIRASLNHGQFYDDIP